MTKVVALKKGYYRDVRKKGDVFVVPFTDEAIEKCSWMAPAGTPLPPERVIPNNRNAKMVDVIKGLPAEEDVPEPADTMSGMTKEHFEFQKAHPRAHGIPTEEPTEKSAAPKQRRRRKQRSDKGQKRGPRKAAQKTEEVAL